MHVPDIPHLPGDAVAVRAAADDIRSTVAELRTARTAAVHVGAICDGAHWRGEAFEVFRAAVDRKPLPAAIDHAIGRMDHAAGALDAFAGRFAENQRRITWCRSRLWSLGLGGGEVPDELVAEVQAIVYDAERTLEDHRVALRQVADTFDRLDDEPTFASPPPSNFEKVTGFAGDALGFAGDVVIGVGQGVWELGEMAFYVSLLGNPITAPYMLNEIWDARDQIGEVLRYAWENPGDFALLVGMSLIDAEAWTEDGIGVWIGRRIPDILLTIASGGLGRVGTSAAAIARGLKGAALADGALDKLRIAERFADFDEVYDAGRAAEKLGESGLTSWPQRLGIDADSLVRADRRGALARADTRLGDLGRRLDQHPVLEIGRQLPGRLNDEIKGVTQLPSRFLEAQYGDNLLTSEVAPIAQRHLDSMLSGGWTGRLGIADGLLVGAPFLSPQTKAAMSGVLSLDVVALIEGRVATWQAVHAGATEGAGAP